MTKFKPVVGIDFGTTFSAIAYIDEHKNPIVIQNAENRAITPSVVNFFDKDKYVVGEEAVNRMLADPTNTVSLIKREMGNSNYKLEIYGRDYTPQEISAKILAKLKKDSEFYFMNKGIDVEIKDAVVTVPADFSMQQKGATKEAAEIAGLNVLHIINEPTAAALAFGVHKIGTDQTVFVFDLGGGTFDVTLLQSKGGLLDMISSDGNAKLGGKEWDDVLVKYCSQLFIDKFGSDYDPQDDNNSYQDLYNRVVQAKITLSKYPKAIIPIHNKGKSLNVEITREKFQELSEKLLDQCRCLSENVLEKADKKWSDIDIILAVGGSTYIPVIRNMIKDISGKEPSTEVNPDQCVAVGAAWKAFLEKAKKKIQDVEEKEGERAAEKTRRAILGHLEAIEVQESVAKSLGVIALNKQREKEVFIMIPEKTKIPCVKEDDSFTYEKDNQTSLIAPITEGEGTKPDEVNIVGEISLDNLPPRKKDAPINLKYVYNKDKILEVEVVDIETGMSNKSKVLLEGGLSDKEKEEAIMHHKQQKQE